MDLVGIEVKTTQNLVAGDERRHTRIVRGTFSQIIDHLTRTPPGSWPGQLNLGEQPVPTPRVYGLQLPPDLQHVIHGRGPLNLDQKRRECFERHRYWNVLHPKRCEPMIGRYEQIVSGDPGLVVERRPMRLHPIAVLVPLQLH